MKKIYTGKTGSGKTYKAIKEAETKGRFAYVAPCMQLVYEVFVDYSREGDSLSTSEVKINVGGEGNFFGTYEALSIEDSHKYDYILIDECHFMTCDQRGGHLYELSQNKNVIMMTATLSFNPSDIGFEEIRLQGNDVIKTRVEYDDFCNNIQMGMSSIYFSKYMPYEASTYADWFNIDEEEIGIISSGTPPLERWKIQKAFRNGNIRLVVCTNVLAQGLNFPAQNILIQHNERDDDEIIEQKLGRLCRPGFNVNEGYYCIFEMPEVKRNKKVNKEKGESLINFVYFMKGPSKRYYLNHEAPSSFFFYKDYKYSLSMLDWELKNNNIREEYFDAAERILDELKDNAQKMKDEILSDVNW